MPHNRIVFTATLGELAEVPGSPFAYWAPRSLRELFKKYPPLDRDVARMPDKEKVADVKQGLATADDLRFTRYWWEVPVDEIATSREETRQGKKWVPFAKGGRPFYHDIALVVNWGNDGEKIKNYIVQRYPYLKGKWEWVIRNESFYFRPGLAWAYIVSSVLLDAWEVAAGCVFSHAGQMVFLRDTDHEMEVCAMLNSHLFAAALQVLDPVAHRRDGGNVAKLPVAGVVLGNGVLRELACLARDLCREWRTGDEVSAVFVAPWIVQALVGRQRGRRDGDLQPVTGHPLARDFSWPDWPSARAIREGLAKGSGDPASLNELAAACVRWQEAVQARLAEIQRRIDDEVYRLYGISDEERALIEAELARGEETGLEEEESEEGAEGPEAEAEEAGAPEGILPAEEHIRRLVHYLAHQVIREDPDGIVPLHDCYPIGATEVERSLPYRVREKLKELFGPDALPQVEREIREALGRPLDEWLATKFFGYHVGLYRLRPVIWQIVPPSESRRARRTSPQGGEVPFSVFICWHRFDADTLRKIRRIYLQSALEAASREVQAAERRLAEARATNASRRTLEEAVQRLEGARARYEALRSLGERLDGLLTPHTLEVHSRSHWVKEKVGEIVREGYRPVRDYGVRVNIEPLKRAGILPRDAQRVGS